MDTTCMNFYEVLGVDKTATSDDIKRAFRSLALQYHPDRNPNNPKAEAQFKELNNAYETLSDNQRRSSYDEITFPKHGTNPEDIFSDLFGDFHGAQNPFSGNMPGIRMHKASVVIKLVETLSHQQHTLNVALRKPCKSCKGASVSGGAERCGECHGAGVVSASKGLMCEACGGAGSIWRACAACKGAGMVETPQEVSINIPRGIINNCPLQVNSPFGPIVVSVVVEYPDNIKLGANGRLIKDIPVPYHVAVLGGTADVELIEKGTIKVKFPPLQHGQLIKIKGKGLYAGPNIRERGDLFLKPYVEVPRAEELPEEHKTIIRQLAKLYSTDTQE